VRRSARKQLPSLAAALALALGLASSSPTTAQPRAPARYRCSFELETPTPKSLVVIASCLVCSPGETERCGPATLPRARAWVTSTGARDSAERRVPGTFRTRGVDDGTYEVNARFRTALRAGAYVLHFAPDRVSPNFRERFEVDAEHHVSRSP